ncbi:MAG: YfhO family protein [Gammaproteobacteria bacterium]|nr:YfhO family protein [Gammaproteobacteria bacterium]
MEETVKIEKRNRFPKLKQFYKNIFSNPFKATLYTGALLFVLMLIYFLIVVFARDNFYSAYSDDIYQYYPIMVDFIESIKTGRVGTFNYTNYLGASFFSDTYYIPLDLFTLAIFLLSYIMPTEIAMSIIEIVKLILGAMSISLYLSYKGYKAKWVHLIGLLYFSSSGITCFSCFSSFTTLAFLLPFSLVIGHWFTKGKWYYVAPYCALSILYNYYLSYTVFAFMAFSIVFMLILDREKWYKVIYKTLIYVGLIIVGLMMSMFIFLPSVLFILKSTTRNVVEGSSLQSMIKMFGSYFEIILESIKSVFVFIRTIFTNKVGFFRNNTLIRDSFVNVRYLYHTLMIKRVVDDTTLYPSFFDPEVLYRIMGSVFVPSSPSSFYGYLGSYFLEHASLYITGIGVLLSSLVIFRKEYKANVYKVILALSIIFMSFPFFSYIFSANLSVLYTRWINVVTIPLLLMAAYVLNETDLKDIKKKHLIISFIILLFFGLFSSFHHYINLTNIAVKNNWSANLLEFEKEAIFYLVILLFAISLALILFYTFKKSSKKVKLISYISIGVALLGVVLALGLKILSTFNIEGIKMFDTSYNGSKPLYDVDALLANELLTIFTLIVIVLDIYFIINRKKVGLIILITIEFALSFGFSFGTPLIFSGEEGVYRKTEELAEIVNSNIDEKDIYRVYVDESISGLERENLARFFGEGTNQDIFHSFINASTDKLVDYLFNVKNEGQANKDKLNTYSYYLNVLLGYRYIVSQVNGGFENYNEDIFDLIYKDDRYIILEFKDYEEFLSFDEIITEENFRAIKAGLNENTKMSYLTQYGVIDGEDTDYILSLISESAEAKKYKEDSSKKLINPKTYVYTNGTTTIDSKEFDMFNVEDIAPTTRSSAVNIFYLTNLEDAVENKNIFFEFDNGERYYLTDKNIRNMNGATIHVPMYGSSSKNININGDSTQIITTTNGERAKLKYIGVASSINKSSICLTFEAIFNSGVNLIDYEDYSLSDATGLGAYIRYSAKDIPVSSLINVSATGLSTSKVIVEYEDGTLETQSAEFKVGKTIKYMFIDKGNMSASAMLPQLTVIYRDENLLYSDNLSNKEVSSTGSSITLSYKRKSLESGYEIIMVPVAYSEEWEVVRGETLGTLSVNGGFLGIIVSKDVEINNITLKFRPRGLKTGSLISLIFTLSYGLIVASYIIIKKKKEGKLCKKSR